MFIAILFEAAERRRSRIAAASVSETSNVNSQNTFLVTYPLDILKTQIQVHKNLKDNVPHPKMLNITLEVVKLHGFSHLWQGLSSALVRHVVYTGIRMPAYEFIRDDIFHIPAASESTIRINHPHNQTDEALPASAKQNLNLNDSGFLPRIALSGIISGGIAQCFASPADLIKVRLQTQQKSNSQLFPAQSQMKHMSAIQITRHLISEGGVLGLWRGVIPNTQRAALVNMGELTTYDTAKRWFAIKFQMDDGPMLHTCASMCSGFVCAILGTPLDMIKTRIMNERSCASSDKLSSGTVLWKSSGMISCTRNIVKNEGFFALYNGFFLIWSRMAPWSLTFWLTYEQIRHMIGVQGF